ncbi:hypothetical protein [Mycolicibacterium conceptionense]|uniref:hypothetical protein n=1 Tax=Mycolicibacterium conceptionense TaxID=451644 RepID=UPI0032048690
MSREEFHIPRIQLPQLGSAAPAESPVEQQGTVRKADDHHDRFRRFLATGDGLDQLVDGVERDTVGSDGRTPDQRSAEAEQAHQKSVQRRYAVDAPVAVTPNTQNLFDDDEFTGCGDGDWSLHGDPSASPSTKPTDAALSAHDPLSRFPAMPPLQQSPEDDDSGKEGFSGVRPADDDDTEQLHYDDEGGADLGDVGQDPPAPSGDDDDEVPPPGSLWESTHGLDSDNYDPGSIVVDPEPDRAGPGPVAQWITDQYQRLWVPLGIVQKVVAVGVIVALTFWVGHLMFASADTAPQVMPADPIVDTAAPPAGPTAAPLPPDAVKAPGCPARSQPPANAFDGKPETAWVCVRAFNTDLQTVIITYSQPVVVCSIFVIPGFEHVDNNGRNAWNEHRIVTRIMWRVGGKPFPQDIDPSAHTGATVQIPCVATQVVTGKIFLTVPPPPVEGDNGPSDEDINSTFAISTITINGYPAGGVPR